MFYKEAVSQETLAVWQKIAASPLAESFYLAGGTALAVQLGHRQSIDLDFFSDKEWAGDEIKRRLAGLGKFEVVSEAPDTLHGLLDGVRVSFFRYYQALLFSAVLFEGLKLADERDIAAMKINAISSRGSKKDFIDLFFLLKKYSLQDVFDFFENKFKGVNYNKLHILKSLTYFEEAEDEPMPIMMEKVGWGEVKRAISNQAIKFLDT